jgi:hypothetical protein
MPPVLEMEATGEQLLQELPERLADFKEQKFHITLTPIERMGKTAESPRKPTIQEEIAALFADIPPEERAKVPADLTDQLDHYIYGTPKK